MLLRNRLPRNCGPHEGVFAGHLIANPNRWTDARAILRTLENAAQHLRDAGVVRRSSRAWTRLNSTLNNDYIGVRDVCVGAPWARLVPPYGLELAPTTGHSVQGPRGVTLKSVECWPGVFLHHHRVDHRRAPIRGRVARRIWPAGYGNGFRLKPSGPARPDHIPRHMLDQKCAQWVGGGVDSREVVNEFLILCRVVPFR